MPLSILFAPLADPSISDHSTKPSLQSWSSLIGIVTAIIGNVLISFALNVQRYAHVRLSQEYELERKSTWKRRRQQTGYGTQGNGVDGRTDRQGAAAPSQAAVSLRQNYQSDPDDEDAHEDDPLARSFQSVDSADTTSTVRSSSNGEKQPPAATQKTYLRSPYWWLGIVLMTIGEAGNFIAYGFAPASIVSPLGVVALISNCVIAPFMLKERFRQRDFWGVVIAVAGAVTIVLSAKSSETKLDPHAIWDLITRWEFETYLGITVAVILALMWASGKYGERTILVDLGLVGLFGGYTALSTKGVASLLSYKLWLVLTFPITYVLLLILVGSALMQIKYINRALQRFDSTQVIPTQFVLFTISVIIGSAILYRDFRQAKAAEVGKFVAGCVLTFSGVYVITSGRPRGGEDWENEEEDEESTVGLEDDQQYQDTSLSQSEHPKQRSTNRTASGQSFGGDASRRISSISPNRESFTPQPPPRLESDSSYRTYATTNSSAASPLLDNPWRSQEDENLGLGPPRPPPLSTAVSSPHVASSSRPHISPSTPRRSSNTPHETPPSSLSRRSVSKLTPGPLMPTLSSSLSAVVADTLRRGVDGSPASRRHLARSLQRPNDRSRPQLGGMRQAASQRVRGPGAAASDGVTSGLGEPGESGAEGSPLKATRSAVEGLGDRHDDDAEASSAAGAAAATSGGSLKGRARSLSSTLSELIKAKKKRRKGNGEGDGEGAE
ncbi:MAG: hypothetical protein M1833_000142 [Piccolia ochrophora]|nr:MAG: hypothetical protein M1833_000142 [Piccolia ochrophora]